MLMPEPVSSASAAVVAGAASGLALGSLWPQPDLALLSGVFCGALVFLLRSKEPSWWKKAAYFCVSLVGGYAITPAVRAAADWLPLWAAAFVSGAAVVAVAIIVLDWLETGVPKALNRLLDRLVGGSRND